MVNDQILWQKCFVPYGSNGYHHRCALTDSLASFASLRNTLGILSRGKCHLQAVDVATPYGCIEVITAAELWREPSENYTDKHHGPQPFKLNRGKLNSHPLAKQAIDHDIDPLTSVFAMQILKPLVNTYIYIYIYSSWLVQLKQVWCVRTWQRYLFKPTLGPPKKLWPDVDHWLDALGVCRKVVVDIGHSIWDDSWGLHSRLSACGWVRLLGMNRI